MSQRDALRHDHQFGTGQPDRDPCAVDDGAFERIILGTCHLKSAINGERRANRLQSV
jgi:hypothetical protein